MRCRAVFLLACFGWTLLNAIAVTLAGRADAAVQISANDETHAALGPRAAAADDAAAAAKLRREGDGHGRIDATGDRPPAGASHLQARARPSRSTHPARRLLRSHAGRARVGDPPA